MDKPTVSPNFYYTKSHLSKKHPLILRSHGSRPREQSLHLRAQKSELDYISVKNTVQTLLKE